MPTMTSAQLNMLGAHKGAYSVVTEREATGDRSVTLDQHEKQVLQDKYHLGSFTRKGGAATDGKPTHFQFQVHSRTAITTASIQDLPITYPKKSGNELRLYMLNAAGFDGKTNDIFYIYYRDADYLPHVGFMPQNDWEALWKNPTASAKAAIQSTNFDEEDEEYQHSIEAVAAKLPVETSGTHYPRDPNIGWRAIKNAGFACEINPEHTTFISSATGRPYMESHHLVPISCQSKFTSGVDVLENIVCLCPTCHRMIHLSEPGARIEILIDLYKRRNELLRKCGITVDAAELLKLYKLA